MGSLVYIRLIGYTAGTLLQLFWMVVILGYRRQRNFERVFFFLCLALFFFYGGSLLALNAQIYYQTPPPILSSFAWTLLCFGLGFLPPLLLHTYVEYGKAIGQWRNVLIRRVCLAAAYAPVVYCVLRAYPQVMGKAGFNFVSPASALGRWYGAWLAGVLLLCAYSGQKYAEAAPDFAQELFHGIASFSMGVAAFAILYTHVIFQADYTHPVASTGIALLPIFPFAVLVYMVQRHNFLQIGRQKNLVYAVSATFLALLYLSLVRRLSVWMEPVVPPEATASILLFVLVIFIEPFQRVLGRRLEETAHREMDRVQRLTAEIQQEARQGNFEALVRFIERRTAEEFEFAAVEFHRFDSSDAALRPKEIKAQPRFSGASEKHFSLRQGERVVGVLHVEPHGAAISGETRVALEFLCEQLPGALDLCRLIEEKLQLERELAQRERLALLGQMAASISHNLKNPLGSIKTILQVQLENPKLPGSMRAETKMVLDEIGRLSTKLNQLLQFSRPAVRPGSAAAHCDVQAVVQEVCGVLRHEAERLGVALELTSGNGAAAAAASAEAVNDIVSNLLVNALEASQRGGHIRVRTEFSDGECRLSVEDDGSGIPVTMRDKILQPFFTTKAKGTGLGLAIVARRAAECGGRLGWQSPAQDGRGTRFEVTLPVEDVKLQ
jgi:signal transduction histidine kinase